MKHFTKKWLCILLSFYASFSFAQVNVQDSLELIRFYNDVCIECPLVWDFLEPVETWEGITVAFGYLREIKLSNENLNGTLADWNFPDLFELHLENNSLTGSLLDFMGMSSLRELDLDDNQLSGTIPNFTNLLNLDLLDLNDNQLSGSIPNFTTMYSLKRLDVDDNQLTGSIPDFSLYNLEVLYIGKNSLSGTIPNFSNLPNLKELYIRDNNLTGTIPDFSNLSNLQDLTIYGNYGIIGALPDFNLPNLTGLNIVRTDISGTIPDFSGMPNLQSLSINRNELTGEIPNFSFLPVLRTLNLEINELTGNIPNFNIPSLQRIYLNSNELTGTIPHFDSLPQLRRLDLSRNGLTDTIPHFTNPILEDIRLNDNQLTGSIPDFTTLSDIEEINLSDNLLSGCFPENFLIYCDETIYEMDFTENICLPNGGDISVFCSQGLGTCNYSPESDSLELVYFQENICTDCTLWDLNQPMSTWQGVTTDSAGRVTELVLQKMNLNGTLVNLNLSELQKIDLDSNRITGNLPCFSNLPNLTHLYLPDNLFEGEIPNYNLPNLISLNLNGNQLGDVSTYVSGTMQKSDIPNFSYLPNLEHLSLGYNQLNGYIPNFDKLPKLTSLFLSFNQLEGNIPKFNLLPDLIVIDLRYNALTGSLPSFSSQPNLVALRLDANKLVGCFGGDLQHLCSVPYVSMWGNYLPGFGDFPSFCANGIGECVGTVTSQDSLELVRFHNETCNEGCSLNWDFERLVNTWTGVWLNEGRVGAIIANNVGLSGTLPNLNLSKLEELNLTDNSLTGQMPDFSQADSLLILHLSDNDFRDTIPDFDLPYLVSLGIDLNYRLEGRLPDFDALNSLSYLKISRTDVSGSIPNYGNFPNLYTLDLSSNNLTGQIPNFNLPKLETLNLSSNRTLGSTIPDFGGLLNLQTLRLSWCRLTGSIPDFQSLINLEVLWVDNNDLTDSIPDFSNLPNLRSLNLVSNDLDGIIPAFSALPELMNLGLARNELTGNVPDFSNSPKLLELYISDNKLSGDLTHLYDLDSLEYLYIDENHFTFDEIEQYLNGNTIQDPDYTPQYHGSTQSYVPDAGDTLTLRLSEPLPGNNNENVSYQWKKEPEEDEEMTVGIDSIYLIENMEPPVHSGIYQVYMTDTMRVPDLEIISEPILLRASGYDLQGEPVVEGELIVEFSDWESKAAYEEQFLKPSGGEPIDSCNCNRLIYLWSLPDNADAYSILIDINTSKHSQNTEGDADGGFNNILGGEPVTGTQSWTWEGDYPHFYPDSVTVFLLDSGTDTVNWDAEPYLVNEAPLDICYDIDASSGFDYTDTLTIIPQFVDSVGHGTYGMRSISEHTSDFMNMKVVPLKVFGEEGRGTLFDFICALYHAIDHGADIINVSAGYSGQPSKILENALIQARQNEQFIVTAAGNEGVNLDSFPQYPAYYADKSFTIQIEGEDSTMQYSNIISVAALNAVDNLWENSNYSNSTVTLSAYGENMAGYSHTGCEVSYSGTSIATYYVTKQLATEIARNKSRELDTIWDRFEEDYLRDCPATQGLTKTGKCLDISLQEVSRGLRVFLEGAFDITGCTMRTDLNTSRHILPGQVDSMLIHATATQPYDVSPFNYYGAESVPPNLDNYPPEVVDWVLISARREIDPNTTVSRTAAWLLKDGRVQLLQSLFDESITAPDSVFIIVEHRNHMGIMSPQKLCVEENTVSWNFTTQDAYTAMGTGTGQVMLGNLRWGMLAGDANNNFDINGDDKTPWEDDNGEFNLYLPADFNMNGDINGDDKAYWFENNGKFSSVQQY